MTAKIPKANIMRGITRNEIRVRLIACRKIFPLLQISLLVNINRTDLRIFARNMPPRKNNIIGPMRAMRIYQLCLDIETGALRSNKLEIGAGPGWHHTNSKTWRDVPNKRPSPMHRLQFGKEGIVIKQGQAPRTGKMPSFAKLFGTKPVLPLSKLGLKI